MGLLATIGKRFLASSTHVTTGTGARSQRWRAPAYGPNTALDYSTPGLRNQSRELMRKNTMAAAGIERLVSNVVGTGIKPQIADEAARKLWLKWTDEAAADCTLDFYGIQAQIFAAVAMAGECFVRLRVRRLVDGLSVPLQLEVLEAEFCPLDKNEPPSGDRGEIRQGVEFDKNVRSRRVAYWMHPRHPNDNRNGLDGNEPIRISASEVLHVYSPTRPGQIRGEPWLARVLDRLTDVEAYDKAELVRKKTSAMFVGFIKRLLPDGLTVDELQEVWGEDATENGGVGEVTLEPGTMQALIPGEDVEFADPKDTGTQYEPYMRAQERKIAAALGILYEQLSGDYSQVNDRTWRAAMGDFKRRCEAWQHNLMVFQLCRPVFRRWAELAVAARALPASFDPAQAPKWTPQRWPYINPAQDIQAIRDEIRSGLTSRTAAVSERGDDAAAIDAEQAEDNKRADGLELVYASDGRQSETGGKPPPPPPEPEKPDPDEDEKVAKAVASLREDLKANGDKLLTALTAMAAMGGGSKPVTLVLPESVTVDAVKAVGSTYTEVEARDEQGRIKAVLIKPVSGVGPTIRRHALHDADGRLTGHQDELIEDHIG